MGTANAGALLFKDSVLGSSLLKLALDGLEREFKFFNVLEGGVCTMCAPRDQRKSSNNQREQAELNALPCQRRADVSERGVISFAKPRIFADHEPRAQFAECAVMELRTGASRLSKKAPRRPATFKKWR
jgi:hypothetical protein